MAIITLLIKFPQNFSNYIDSDKIIFPWNSKKAKQCKRKPRLRLCHKGHRVPCNTITGKLLSILPWLLLHFFFLLLLLSILATLPPINFLPQLIQVTEQRKWVV